MTTMTNTRILEDSDIDQVLDLMRLSLGETSLLQRTPDLFRWKHISNPFGRSIALVAEEAGRIVGLRTFMRWELDTPSGDRLRCVRAVDTATHPDFQRRGIFRRLTEEALEIAQDDRVDLVFNTPNSSSKPGYIKMGWSEVGRIGAMVRPSRFLLTRGVEGDSPELYLKQVAPIDVATLEDRRSDGLRTPRSKEYLSWRFASHPKARYLSATKDGATAVLRPHIRNGRREIVVADLFGDPANALDAALRVKRFAYMATWFNEGAPERGAAIRRWFLPVPGLAALSLVMKPLTDLPPSYQSLAAWDFAVSDLELL